MGAIGTGGRKIRTFTGDTWDHFEIIYEYPGDCRISFCSTQFLKMGWGNAGQRFNGSKGVYDGHQRPVSIQGEKPWTPAKEADREGDSAEILKMKAFYQSIIEKKYVNEVAQGVEATLTAILGRTAAYRSKPITWDELIKENEELKTDV